LWVWVFLDAVGDVVPLIQSEGLSFFRLEFHGMDFLVGHALLRCPSIECGDDRECGQSGGEFEDVAGEDQVFFQGVVLEELLPCGEIGGLQEVAQWVEDGHEFGLQLCVCQQCGQSDVPAFQGGVCGGAALELRLPSHDASEVIVGRISHNCQGGFRIDMEILPRDIRQAIPLEDFRVGEAPFGGSDRSFIDVVSDEFGFGESLLELQERAIPTGEIGDGPVGTDAALLEPLPDQLDEFGRGIEAAQVDAFGAIELCRCAWHQGFAGMSMGLPSASCGFVTMIRSIQMRSVLGLTCGAQ